MGDPDANWSFIGAYALLDHLEDVAAENGEDMFIDRVAIRHDFGEYKNIRDWAKTHSCVSLFDTDEHIREYVRERGSLIEFEGGIIVSRIK